MNKRRVCCRGTTAYRRVPPKCGRTKNTAPKPDQRACPIDWVKAGAKTCLTSAQTMSSEILGKVFLRERASKYVYRHSLDRQWFNSMQCLDFRHRVHDAQPSDTTGLPQACQSSQDYSLVTNYLQNARGGATKPNKLKISVV